MVKTPVSHNFFTKSEKKLLEQLSTYISCFKKHAATPASWKLIKRVEKSSIKVNL